jgi:hypothetical protein
MAFNEKWQQASDDPAFIYALDTTQGVNIFDLKINRGYHAGKRTSETEIAEIARLIAAAPDLLAALEIALPYVESFDGDNADLQTKANAEAVRAAIAKAKGE